MAEAQHRDKRPGADTRQRELGPDIQAQARQPVEDILRQQPEGGQPEGVSPGPQPEEDILGQRPRWVRSSLHRLRRIWIRLRGSMLHLLGSSVYLCGCGAWDWTITGAAEGGLCHRLGGAAAYTAG